MNEFNADRCWFYFIPPEDPLTRPAFASFVN